MLEELLDLLAGGTLSPQEREEALAEVTRAPEEIDWVDSPEQAHAVAIAFALPRRCCASSDKADETHEQLQQIMGGDFPDYPGEIGDPPAYHRWLDEQFLRFGGTEGRGIVQLDDTVSEDTHLFVVRRRDMPRILEIAEALELRIYRPLDYWARLGF